jgi:hypothetical protein
VGCQDGHSLPGGVTYGPHGASAASSMVSGKWLIGGLVTGDSDNLLSDHLSSG